MKQKFIILSLLSILLIFSVFFYRRPIISTEKDGWSIGFGHFKSIQDSKNIEKNQVFSIEKLRKESDSTIFLADPFFIQEKGIYHLFFEHQKIQGGAEIGLLTSINGEDYKYKGTVLKQNFHLSYPQVFKYRNQFYMLPETQGSNNVLLYKAENFPYDWNICDTLIKNIKLKDPTIFLSDTLNILVGTNNQLTMHLYNANELFGEWKLNDKRPIIMKGTESRCAGRFISVDNDLILPVQNSSKGYGYGVSLYRFKFNKKDYSISRESKLHFKANENVREFNAGMHHLDIQRDTNNTFYAVYDGNTFKENGNLTINIRGSLKSNYIDFTNWIYQLIK